MDNIKTQEPLPTQKELQVMLWRIEARGEVIPLNSKFRPEPLHKSPNLPSKDSFIPVELVEEMLMEGHCQWGITGNVLHICCKTTKLKSSHCINNTERWNWSLESKVK